MHRMRGATGLGQCRENWRHHGTTTTGDSAATAVGEAGQGRAVAPGITHSKAGSQRRSVCGQRPARAGTVTPSYWRFSLVPRILAGPGTKIVRNGTREVASSSPEKLQGAAYPRRTGEAHTRVILGTGPLARLKNLG